MEAVGLFCVHRYMLGISVIPAVVQFLGFCFLPESPRWLLQKGHNEQARHVLTKIRETENVDEEYDSIKAIIDEEEKDAGGEQLHRYINVIRKNRNMSSPHAHNPQIMHICQSG